MAKKSEGPKQEHKEKKAPKKSAEKKGAPGSETACGNAACWLKADCGRFNKKAETVFESRRNKCEHFLGK